MIKHLLSFALAFVVGATLALGARTVRHDPHALTEGPSTTAHSEHAVLAADSAPRTEIAPVTEQPTVNSVCAICGMPVDPALPTAEYRGKRIGFGCRACPAKFAKDPDRYGPSALENKVMEE
jgi:YHS domain-containing protein